MICEGSKSERKEESKTESQARGSDLRQAVDDVVGGRVPCRKEGDLRRYRPVNQSRHPSFFADVALRVPPLSEWALSLSVAGPG